MDRQVVRVAAAAFVAAAVLGAALAAHGHPAYGREAAFQILLGAAFGAVLQRARFCMTSAFRDLFLLRDRRTMLGVLTALAAGCVGYAVLFEARLPDPSRWTPPLAHILPTNWHVLAGGTVFGAGMVLAGGCISGQLYRLGEGQMTAPVALAMMVPGYWLAYSIWDWVYVKAVAREVFWLPRSTGYAVALAVHLAALGAVAAYLLWKFPALPPKPGEPATLRTALRKTFVDGWPAWLGGLAVGAIATLAYLRTVPLSTTGEINRLSHALGKTLGVAPAELAGLGKLPGCRPEMTTGALTLNALFVLAAVAGAFAAALGAGEFRPRLGRPRSLALAAAGGLLMGFGAMISIGCTIGSFLSGFMAFSAHAWVMAAGLMIGAWLGVKLLRRWA
ncbi:MAG TPA: YeeE/YedE family protein [Planctomycetota bacterium]|nr:YeeE/YedE family protein [Planctomycetota bacterium]